MQDMPLDEFVKSESKYLSKEDVSEAGIVLTIAGASFVELEADGVTKTKPAISFKEKGYKPMVLGPTTREQLKRATGASLISELIGLQIGVYCDPNVSYQGKLVGGARIKKASECPAQPAVGEPDDDIPF